MLTAKNTVRVAFFLIVAAITPTTCNAQTFLEFFDSWESVVKQAQDDNEWHKAWVTYYLIVEIRHISDGMKTPKEERLTNHSWHHNDEPLSDNELEERRSLLALFHAALKNI